MDRRTYLTGVVAGTVALAGCESLPGSATGDEDDEDDGTTESDPRQVQVVREYYSALNEGDADAANRLIHPDAPAGEVSEEGASYFEENIDIGVTDAQLRGESGDTAEVTATVLTRTEESEDPSREEWVFELRRTDDGWQIYEANRVESTDTPTPDEPTEQTTNRLQAVSTVGTNIQSETVQTVEVVVAKAPGAAEIDLSGVVVEWVGPAGVSRLTYGDTARQETFGVEPIKDEDGSLSGARPVLNDPADRAVLTFDVPAFAGEGLAEGAEVSLTLQTESGGTTDVYLTVPQTLADANAVNL